MLLTPLALAAGLVLGLIRGGSFSALRSVHVRVWPVLLLGVVLQTAEQWGDLPGRLALFLVGLSLLVIGCMQNAHLKGAAITGFGLTLNLLVVLFNGYVPLRVESFKAIGGMPSDANPADWTVVNGLWRFEDGDTVLRGLGDIVPVTALNAVISFGDLILLAGLGVVSMNLLLRQPGHSIALEELFPDAGGLDLRSSVAPDDAALDDAAPHSPVVHRLTVESAAFHHAEIRLGDDAAASSIGPMMRSVSENTRTREGDS